MTMINENVRTEKELNTIETLAKQENLMIKVKSNQVGWEVSLTGFSPIAKVVAQEIFNKAQWA